MLWEEKVPASAANDSAAKVCLPLFQVFVLSQNSEGLSKGLGRKFVSS